MYKELRFHSLILLGDLSRFMYFLEIFKYSPKVDIKLSSFLLMYSKMLSTNPTTENFYFESYKSYRANNHSALNLTATYGRQPFFNVMAVFMSVPLRTT